MMNVASLGYGLAALAFLLLTAIGLHQWRAWRHFTLFAIASLLTACWALASSLEALSLGNPASSSLFLELLRNVAWLGFLLHILEARRPKGEKRPAFLTLLILGGLGLPALLAIDMAITMGSGTLPRLIPGLRHTFWLLTSLIGLILVEQVYRGARPDGRWALKFLSLGLGALFVYDFYSYTHLVLFRSLDEEIWQARGFAVALVAPLLGLAASRGMTDLRGHRTLGGVRVSLYNAMPLSAVEQLAETMTEFADTERQRA